MCSTIPRSAAPPSPCFKIRMFLVLVVSASRERNVDFEAGQLWGALVLCCVDETMKSISIGISGVTQLPPRSGLFCTKANAHCSAGAAAPEVVIRCRIFSRSVSR